VQNVWFLFVLGLGAAVLAVAYTVVHVTTARAEARRQSRLAAEAIAQRLTPEEVRAVGPSPLGDVIDVNVGEEELHGTVPAHPEYSH
jgi:uncharacterized protein YfaQ (DUF2300 family)